MSKRLLSTILIIAGVGILLYPSFQFLQSRHQQHRLEQKLANRIQAEAPHQQTADPQSATLLYPHFDRDFAPPPPTPEPPREPVYVHQLTKAELPQTVVAIPKIDVLAEVYYGTDTATLKKGPGLYIQGVVPGDNGNVGIAAHRVTYGRWFRNLDKLKPGDEVIVYYGDSVYTYVVERTFVVEKNDWSVMDRSDEPILTLTTCHPPGSSRQRLVARAQLQE